MIRILHVVTTMDRAGLETIIMNYYRCVNREQVQFDFLVHRNKIGDYDEEINLLGGKIYKTYSISPRNFIRYIVHLNHFFKKHSEYKIVHSHIDALSTFVLYAAKKANIPIRIAHSHTSAFEFDRKVMLRYISKLMLPKVATNYFGCSKNSIKFMFGPQVLKNKNYILLKNAIDLNRFSFHREVRENYRNLLNINNKFVVGHIGRFITLKNHEFLLNVFYELYKLQDDAVLILLGDGPLYSSMQDMSKKLGIEDAVKFLGVRSDVAEFLQAMDVFLLPSLFEGLPVVLIEAQATGLPCIVSSSVSNEAKILDSTHFISLQRSAKEWADAILELSLRRDQNASKLLRLAGYDIKLAAHELENFYISKINNI